MGKRIELSKRVSADLLFLRRRRPAHHSAKHGHFYVDSPWRSAFGKALFSIPSHCIGMNLGDSRSRQMRKNVPQTVRIALLRPRLEDLPAVPEKLFLQLRQRVVVVEKVKIGLVGSGLQIIQDLDCGVQVAGQSFANPATARIEISVVRLPPEPK